MPTISNSIAGMRAAAVRATVAAENIVKSNVKDFKALDYTQTADVNGGPKAVVQTRTPPTVKTLDQDGNIVDMPNVSFDEELIQSQIATNDFKANATVVKISRQMQGSLLDIFA